MCTWLIPEAEAIPSLILVLLNLFIFCSQRPTSFPKFYCFSSTAEEAPEKGQIKKVVYPKVKVRQQQDQGDQHGVHDFYTSVKEYEDVSPPSVAKIPKSYVPSVAMPTMSVPEGSEKKNEKFDEDNQQNIRASSIPRPRAVLSSPDNDLVIGNKNRMKAESRASVLKNRNSVQNRHAQSQCKVFSSHTTENSMNTKKSKEATDESNLKGRQGSVGTVPSQRRQPRTGKPSSMRT